MDHFKKQRQRMVKDQIAARGIQDPKLLQAMEKVPRELFVDSTLTQYAYDDNPLPIEEGQTISQPFIVAFMAEQAELKPQDKVLEIGTGSGYSAAVLSQLVAHVYSIERHSKLANIAKIRLKNLGYTNTTISEGDGTIGWEDYAPYDAIIVTAGGPDVPPTLLKQLAIHGRLIMPVGPISENQQLIKVIREDENHYHFENICSVRFVPLLGQEGWKTTLIE